MSTEKRVSDDGIKQNRFLKTWEALQFTLNLTMMYLKDDGKIVQQFLFYIVEESSHIFFKLLPKCLNIMYFWNYVFALMLDETLNFQGKRKLDRQYMKFILFPTVHIFMSKAVKESKRKLDSKRYTIFFLQLHFFIYVS